MLFAASGSKGFGSYSLVAAAVFGYLLSVSILGVVLGPTLAEQPILKTALQAACGAWVIWLAVKIWRVATQDNDVSVNGSTDMFATTMLNPKGIIIAVGLLPNTELTASLVTHLGTVLALAGLAGVLWVVLGKMAVKVGHRHHIERVFSLILGSFGAAMMASASS